MLTCTNMDKTVTGSVVSRSVFQSEDRRFDPWPIPVDVS